MHLSKFHFLSSVDWNKRRCGGMEKKTVEETEKGKFPPFLLRSSFSIPLRLLSFSAFFVTSPVLCPSSIHFILPVINGHISSRCSSHSRPIGSIKLWRLNRLSSEKAFLFHFPFSDHCFTTFTDVRRLEIPNVCSQCVIDRLSYKLKKWLI